MKNLCNILLAVVLAAATWACSDDDYEASVTELRLVRVTPTSVNSGDLATLLGRNFSTEPDENVVTIDGVRAEVIEAKKDELQIIVPALDPGRHEIAVSCPSGELGGIAITYLKKPDHDYLVSTIIGRKGVADMADGVGTDATTKLPTGLCYAPDGSIWFTERGYNWLRRFDANLNVSSIADVKVDGSSAIWQGGFNSKGEYYFIDKAKGLLRHYDAATKTATTVASGMKSPMNVCFDADDNMYVSARDNYAVYKFTPSGEQTTYADLSTYKRGVNYCTFDHDGNLLVGLNGYNLILVKPDGTHSIVAGTGASADRAAFDSTYDGEPGDLLTAKIGPTFGIAVAPDGTVYYSDNRYHAVRKIVRGADGTYEHGTMETIVGNGSAGSADGVGMKATFNQPYELLISPDGSVIYVLDTVNYLIRKISIK